MSGLRFILVLVLVVMFMLPPVMSVEERDDGQWVSTRMEEDSTVSHDEGSDAKADDDGRRLREAHDDCARLYDELRTKLRTLDAEFRKAWEGLQDRHAREMDQARDRDERAALQERHDKELQKLRADHHGAMEQAHAEYGKECRAQEDEKRRIEPAPAQAFCADPEVFSLFDGRIHRMVDAFTHRQDSALERFVKQERDREQRFFEERRTQQEEEAFFAEQESRFEEFKNRMQTEQRAFRDDLHAQQQRYLGQMQERCRPDDGVFEPERSREDRFPREVELLRVDCELRAERAMMASTPRDDGSVKEVFRECQERSRELWQRHIQEVRRAPSEQRFGSWSVEEDGSWIHLEGRFVGLVGYKESSSMGRVTVGDRVWIEHLETRGELDRFLSAQEGGQGVLEAGGDGLRLMVHDDPTGLIRMHSERSSAFFLTFPSDAQLERAPGGYVVKVSDARALLRVAPDDLDWDPEARLATISGEAVFLVPEDAQNLVLPAVANQQRERITQAVQDRRVGAEVTVASVDGEPRHAALVYDDVAVHVESRLDQRKVELTVSSDSLSDGRAFVLNVDRDTLGAGSDVLRLLGNFEVKYFNVDPETGHEEAQEITRVDSLEAVLRHTGASPVYWYDVGSDGVQFAVSVPHWSVHKFTVTADPDGFSLPIPAPIGVGVLLSLAGVLYRLGRRRAKRDTGR